MVCSGLGLLLLMAPLHWEWFLCADWGDQQQTEYRQTFQHDGGNVSQIYRLETRNGETISGMESEKNNLTVIKVLSEVTWKPILAFTGLPWAILGVYDLIRSEFVPIPDQDKLQILRFLPSWQWRTWALCSCVIFIFLTINGTYRALLRRHRAESALREQIALLTQQMENRIPNLHLEVWEVLIIRHLMSAEVFVDASVANSTPDTQGAVRQFTLALEIAGKTLEAQKNRTDLDDYRLIDRSDIKMGLIQPFRFTLLADLASSMNSRNPVLYGVPHRGWIHFSFADIPDWPTSMDNVLYFVRAAMGNKLSTEPRTTFWGSWIEQGEIGVSIDSVKGAIVSIENYLGPDATSFASVNKASDHLIIKVERV
jgi:hypothetical protein